MASTINYVNFDNTAIRHGNSATLAWVASEGVKEKKIKKALSKCFRAIRG